MRSPFEIARGEINRNTLLQAIGERLRVEHRPIEESLPEPLAALLDHLQKLLSQETE